MTPSPIIVIQSAHLHSQSRHKQEIYYVALKSTCAALVEKQVYRLAHCVAKVGVRHA
jgi:hypothetical protein